METTEKIVEAYARYVRGWATIPNLRCAGQKEIDLFAIDPVTDERWHIETSVSISTGFSKLTNDPYEPGEHKVRVKGAGARRKLGFFLAEKFLPEAVKAQLAKYGCKEGGVRRAIVTWDCKLGVVEAASELGIEVWKLPDLMAAIAEVGSKGNAYFGDDTLRTITLFARGAVVAQQESKPKEHTNGQPVGDAASGDPGTRFYVYENWVHKRARLHRGDCSYCKDGKGSQGSTSVANGQWYGPYPSREAAEQRLSQISQPNKSPCATCCIRR